MQESTGRGSSKKDNDSAEDSAGADSEAISKEKLSDLEENREDVGSSSSKHPGPSPDGALDESDEISDAGPM